MKASFKVHAGLAPTLSVTAPGASAFVFLPGPGDGAGARLQGGHSCPGPVIVAAGDRLRAAWFTVDDVRISKGRGSSHPERLSGPTAWSGRVHFDDDKPLLRRLCPGDRETGTVWRGDIVAVFARDAGRWSSAHSVGGRPYAAGFGIALVMSGSA